MNKSQRIYLDVNNPNSDKYVKLKLEQNIDTLEFLSMNLSTKDAYQNFNSDYGVLVGRVIANEGIGIPNAKISIFIPLSDDDAENGEIYSLYPYKTPRDKNQDGKRYNLLPRVAKKDPVTGIVSPKQPFGSFPIKEEIIVNEPFLNIYKKYYKYTALTNNTGDYMIFGVPVGTQTVHMSVDITDIGKYSMTPASMIKNLGYSPNLFTEGGNKIKESPDLDDLPNIETQEISVNVIPFWGDTENFEIGITRQDFRIRSVLKNTFIIFGSVFTDGDKKTWGRVSSDDKNRTFLLYEMTSNAYENEGIQAKRFGKVTEKIYYYPPSVSDDEISYGAVDKMLLLDPNEYSFYKNNGDFVLIINCNRDKVIVNEDGTQTPVDINYKGGLYTSFKGFMTLEITDDELKLDWTDHGNKLYIKPIRQILKFPQMANKYRGFRKEDGDGNAASDTDSWRRQHYKFCGGGIYSVAKFHGLVFNSGCEKDVHQGYIDGDVYNQACREQTQYNVGLIQTNDFGYTGNTYHQMCSNSHTISCADGLCREVFGANWLNMSVYLPQTSWVYDNYSYIQDNPRVNTQFAHVANNTYYLENNQQKIAGVYLNTCSFARSDINWTDFICVPKDDILAMSCIGSKGIKSNNNGSITINNCDYVLKGTYRNGMNIPTGQTISWTCAAPLNGGRCNGDCCCACVDCRTYFYKGFGSSDVINYITSLGIV